MFLGVNISSDLTWSRNISYQVGKAQQRLLQKVEQSHNDCWWILQSQHREPPEILYSTKVLQPVERTAERFTGPHSHLSVIFTPVVYKRKPAASIETRPPFHLVDDTGHSNANRTDWKTASSQKLPPTTPPQLYHTHTHTVIYVSYFVLLLLFIVPFQLFVFSFLTRRVSGSLTFEAHLHSLLQFGFADWDSNRKKKMDCTSLRSPHDCNALKACWSDVIDPQHRCWPEVEKDSGPVGIQGNTTRLEWWGFAPSPLN